MICPKCGRELQKCACNCGFDLNNETIILLSETKDELSLLQKGLFDFHDSADPSIDLSKINWDYKAPFVYDGTIKTVAISSEKRNPGFLDKLLGREGKVYLTGVPEGYDVIYGNNSATDAGVYQATARLVSKTNGQKNDIEIEPLTWEIKKAIPDLSNAKWNYSHPFIYDGTERRVELSGLPDCVTARYYNNVAAEAGSYKAAVVLRTTDFRNYEAPGIVSNCNWQIEKARYDLTQVRWTYDDDSFYDGKEKTVSVIGLPEGVRIEDYRENKAIDVGSYTAEAIVKYENQDNYAEPYIPPLNWRIRKKQYDMSNVRWVYNGDYTYDGKEKTVRVTGLPEGVRIEDYRENKAIEAGKYTAEAIVKYDEEFYEEPVIPPLEWWIHKRRIDTSGVSWNYDDAFVYDGEEKIVELIGLPDTVEVTYTDNTGINAGDHEALAMIEAKDPRNYETPRPVRGCRWHINKARYDMSEARWAYDGEIEYNGKEKSVKVTGLPEGVRVESYRGNRGIEAGSYTAEVQLRCQNKENFEEPVMPPLKWKIRKHRIDVSGITWDYNEETRFVYDDKVKTVKLRGVPEDVEVVYLDNSKINAGTYTASARLIYDTRNCEIDKIDKIPDLRWRIEKANYDVSDVYWTYDKPFVYDGTEKSIVLKGVPDTIAVRYRDTRASAIGTYTAKAYLTYDRDNYEMPDIETTIDWSIVPQDE